MNKTEIADIKPTNDSIDGEVFSSTLDFVADRLFRTEEALPAVTVLKFAAQSRKFYKEKIAYKRDWPTVFPETRMLAVLEAEAHAYERLVETARDQN